ncbi:MAG: carbon-nitrogen hydrolase family protein [Hyphomonadaceae bacterium JAD_PAG50586_4]|nr:MAG: carbon-nitrogen hydrolase family protein [Hyphomonadaceae bacterium JAD_PAG50586_4]
MSTLAVAGLQLELDHGDNIDAIGEEVRALKRRFPWIDMAVVGELAAFGPKLDKAQPLPGPAEQRFAEIARECGLWLIPGSIYERQGGNVYNTTPVINPDGEVIARYRKMYPFLPYEQDVAAGAQSVAFDVPGKGRLGVSICYDMWFPETTRTLAWMGAEAILHLVMTNTIDRDVELAMARSAAATNQCYVLDINVAGRLGYGRSLVAGPGGEIIHQAGAEREIIPVEIDFDYVRRVRERGWHGLGQVLKSYRDGGHSFPQYAPEAASAALNRLGALEKPQGGDAGASQPSAARKTRGD